MTDSSSESTAKRSAAPETGAGPDTLMEVDLDAGVHDLEFIHYEKGGGAGVSLFVFRSVGIASDLNENEWELLRAFGGGTAPFEITDIVVDGGQATLTWGSNPGESFIVEQKHEPSRLGRGNRWRPERRRYHQLRRRSRRSAPTLSACPQGVVDLKWPPTLKWVAVAIQACFSLRTPVPSPGLPDHTLNITEAVHTRSAPARRT